MVLDWKISTTHSPRKSISNLPQRTTRSSQPPKISMVSLSMMKMLKHSSMDGLLNYNITKIQWETVSTLLLTPLTQQKTILPLGKKLPPPMTGSTPQSITPSISSETSLLNTSKSILYLFHNLFLTFIDIATCKNISNFSVILPVLTMLP